MGNELTTRWYSDYEYMMLLKQVKPGDLIEFDRGFYTHWGVYVGKKKVIHFTSPVNTTSSNVVCRSHSTRKGDFELGCVMKHRLVDVAMGCKVRINNGGDKNNTPRNENAILQSASDSIFYYDEYNVVRNNCEHFAKYCRYGKKMGAQVGTTFGEVMGILAAVGIAAVTAAVFGRPVTR